MFIRATIISASILLYFTQVMLSIHAAESMREGAAVGHLESGLSFEKNGQLAGAIAEYRKAVKANANDLYAWIRLAMASHAKERSKRPELLACKAMDLRSTKECTTCARKAQIEDFWQKIECQPDNVNLWLRLSSAYGWEEHEKAHMACRVADLLMDANQDGQQDAQQEKADSEQLALLPNR